MGTMIHELTHMVISPHNAKFYSLMDELAEEISADISNPNRTIIDNLDVFSGKANILGSKGQKVEATNKSSLREKMLTEALRREGLQKLGENSGQVLNPSKSKKREYRK